ncbi:hypothetical protein [Achromobacter sp. DH1f]|uniref:hypothetical protein n=1 Tax=Achromobacter sp. DH1f TaxID=1397275 RepID=UPI000469D3CF|nr:hypothetical protein [Achromobacter sp. DH1f]
MLALISDWLIALYQGPPLAFALVLCAASMIVIVWGWWAAHGLCLKDMAQGRRAFRAHPKHYRFTLLIAAALLPLLIDEMAGDERLPLILTYIVGAVLITGLYGGVLLYFIGRLNWTVETFGAGLGRILITKAWDGPHLWSLHFSGADLPTLLRAVKHRLLVLCRRRRGNFRLLNTYSDTRRLMATLEQVALQVLDGAVRSGQREFCLVLASPLLWQREGLVRRLEQTLIGQPDSPWQARRVEHKLAALEAGYGRFLFGWPAAAGGGVRAAGLEIHLNRSGSQV